MSWWLWNASSRSESGPPPAPRRAAIGGIQPVYPASVSKLFFLLATQATYDDGRLAPSPELDRLLADMITLSGNDATHLDGDMLAGASGGLDLPEPEMALWFERRQAMNRYFRTLG